MTAWQHTLAESYLLLEWSALILAVFIALSALDDIAIDVWYWWRRLVRWRMARSGVVKALGVEQLRDRAEQPIAIMVPAWKEYDVIAQMIESMVAVLEYKNYTIFVDTYCNDDATRDEVDRMRRRYRQLQRVEVPHPGPTCKADCLNWVVQAIAVHEQKNDMEFAGMILHDSEDVLHPLELKFFNYLLPRMDLIQLPVFSLERHWYELVAGTYMDEFAESHGKDMLVREHISGIVPSAGVGTCFSRRAIRALCETTDNQPFNTSSLTEDYDIGNRLARMGMRSIFAVLPVEYTEYKSNGTSTPEVKRFMMPLSVREFFPDTFLTAYRQKSRWTLGIGLQSWEQIKFTGSWAAKYLLLRDRKGVFTAFISMLAYLSLLGFIAFHMLSAAGIWTVYYPSVFSVTEWFLPLMYFNAFSFLNRALHRIYFVTTLYGWQQGLWSLPRMIVGNFVNFMAVMRAWRMFLRYLFLGKPLVWDKTMHDFPSADVLAGQKRRLGELLVSWQAIGPDMLDKGVSEHQALRLPLGRVLVMNGWLDDETLAEAIAYQTGYARTSIDLATVWANRDQLPVDLCVQLRALYLGVDEHQRPLLAVAGPLAPVDMKAVANVLGADPVLRIVRESEIHAGLRHWREGMHKLSGESAAQAWHPAAEFAPGVAPPLLGDLLANSQLIDRSRFEHAMSAYRPSLHGRVGAYLVDQGVVTREQVDMVLAMQRSQRSMFVLSDGSGLSGMLQPEVAAL